MLTWSTRNKFAYTALFLGILFTGVGFLYFGVFYNAPSCDDKTQNQDEEGVDCGGVCLRVCEEALTRPIILWSRVFPLVPGMYNALAYIENPNARVGARNITYQFKLYDENNVIVAERAGKTFIGPNDRFAIFEPRIQTRERIPKYAFLEFLDFSEWEKVDPSTNNSLFVRTSTLKDTESSPRLDVTLLNDSIVAITDIEVIAIVYDSDDNAIGVSRTEVEIIKGDSSRDITFTWPQPFDREAVRTEVVSRINPFDF